MKSWELLEKYLIETRYAIRDSEGRPLEHSLDEVVARIVKQLRADDRSSRLKPSRFFDIKQFSQALHERILIPATPALISYGNNQTKRKGYFSCYPLGYVPDSMQGISEWCSKMERIYMCGGGAGADLSYLRPRGSVVDSGQGTASGPVGFLSKFDAVTGTTNQGGRRRGALLMQLYWKHKDIKDFILAKAAAAKVGAFTYTLPEEIRPAQNPILSNMNLSVVVDKEFFEHPELVDLVARNMWESGDPGLLFVDNMLRYSPFREEHEPRFSNPCGEYLSPANLACNLVTINVGGLAFSCVESWDLHKWKFNMSKFLEKVQQAAYLACGFGNYLIILDEGYPLDEIRRTTQEFRPVGVGMSGFHTALILATQGESAYGSPESCEFASKVQANLTYGTLIKSSELAFKFDQAYINQNYWLKHLDDLSNQNLDTTLLAKAVERYGGFYNCVTTSQPPTGAVSQLLRNIDTGIEPFFKLELKGRKVRDFDKGWVEFDLKPIGLDTLLENQTFRAKCEAQTSLNISPESQLHILSDIQRFVHTGVSKTVNVPAKTSAEQIKSLILEARSLSLKGFTVFRDGSRESVLGSIIGPSESIKDLKAVRPAKVFEVRGPLIVYVIVSFDDNGRPREMFLNVGTVGTTLHSMFSAFGKIISVALRRYPALVDRFVNTLSGIESGELFMCEVPETGKILRSNSLPDMIAKILDHLRSESADFSPTKKKEPVMVGDICPHCGKLALVRKGSCKDCTNCGFSTC